MPSPRYDLPDIARRLDRILRDLGYAGEEGEGDVDLCRACRVINRRTRRPMSEARFKALTGKKGDTMTAAEATQVAEALGFDVRRLLYDDIPRRPERPDNILDELDWIGIPD